MEYSHSFETGSDKVSSKDSDYTKRHTIMEKLIYLSEKVLTKPPPKSMIPKLLSQEPYNYLIVSLFNKDKGYTVSIKGLRETTDIYTFKYSNEAFLKYIKNQRVPPECFDVLVDYHEKLFYDGYMIVEIRDYRPFYNEETLTEDSGVYTGSLIKSSQETENQEKSFSSEFDLLKPSVCRKSVQLKYIPSEHRFPGQCSCQDPTLVEADIESNFDKMNEEEISALRKNFISGILNDSPGVTGLNYPNMLSSNLKTHQISKNRMINNLKNSSRNCRMALFLGTRIITEMHKPFDLQPVEEFIFQYSSDSPSGMSVLSRKLLVAQNHKKEFFIARDEKYGMKLMGNKKFVKVGSRKNLDSSIHLEYHKYWDESSGQIKVFYKNSHPGIRRIFSITVTNVPEPQKKLASFLKNRCIPCFITEKTLPDKQEILEYFLFEFRSYVSGELVVNHERLYIIETVNKCYRVAKSTGKEVKAISHLSFKDLGDRISLDSIINQEYLKYLRDFFGYIKVFYRSSVSQESKILCIKSVKVTEGKIKSTPSLPPWSKIKELRVPLKEKKEHFKDMGKNWVSTYFSLFKGWYEKGEDLKFVSFVDYASEVRIIKEKNEDLGIVLGHCPCINTNDRDYHSEGIFITEILPNSAAHKNGKLKVGMKVAKIQNVTVVTLEQANKVLKEELEKTNTAYEEGNAGLYSLTAVISIVAGDGFTKHSEASYAFHSNAIHSDDVNIDYPVSSAEEKRPRTKTSPKRHYDSTFDESTTKKFKPGYESELDIESQMEEFLKLKINDSENESEDDMGLTLPLNFWPSVLSPSPIISPKTIIEEKTHPFSCYEVDENDSNDIIFDETLSGVLQKNGNTVCDAPRETDWNA